MVDFKISNSHIFRLAPLLTLAVLVFIGGCNRSREAEQQATRNTLEKDVQEGREKSVQRAVVTGIKLSGGDGKGNTLWKIRAKTAEYSGKDAGADSNNARLKEAEAELYRNGKLESSFKAAQIDLVRSDKATRLTMSGQVRAHTSGPWTGKRGPVSLQAPHAEVDINTRRIWAKQGATMSQGTGETKVDVSAREVHADTALHTTTLKNTVRAATTKGTLTADAATWNWETGRAQATGKVSATHEGTTISGARIDADSRAQRGVLQGGVKATAAEGAATAQQVHYDWGGGKLTASGGVTLEKDGATLRAGRIVTDNKLNGASAEGGVTLQKDGATLRAGRIVSDNKFTGARAEGGVTLQKDGATIRAARAQAFDQMTRATASGNVTATRGNITMRADRVQATNLNDDSKARMSADGGVRVTQSDMVVTASHVDASGMANKSATHIVATGGVRFSQKGKTVTAARVEATGLSKTNAQLTATGGVKFSDPEMAVNAARVEAAGFAQTPPTRIIATGGVVARGKGATVRAGRVQRDSSRIVATGNVTLTKDGNTLSGQRLESNDDFKTASLTGNVHARTTDGGIITAGVLRWQNAAGAQAWESGRILARDGVNMSQDGMKLRGNQLDAMASGAAAVLTGNVVVTTATGATLRAPSARYDKKADKIYANGGVVYEDKREGIRHQSKTLVYSIKSETIVTTEGQAVTKMDPFNKDKKIFKN